MHISFGWRGAGHIALWGVCAGLTACNGGDETDTDAATTAATTTTASTSGASPPATTDSGDEPTTTTPPPATTDTTDTPTTDPPTTGAATTTTTTDPGDSTTTDTTATDTTTDPSTTDSGALEPTCDDGLKNQDETAIDCGGACPGCVDGLACFVDADCEAATCDDLVCGDHTFGTWGLGTIGNVQAYKAFVPALHGYHFRFEWSAYETAAGTFSDTYIKDNVTTAVGDGLLVGFMMIVSPANTGATPAWLFNAPYNVPKVVTTTMQTFPHYFNNTYKQRYFGMLDQLRAEVAGWQPALNSEVLFWQSAEGSTGDEGPYKGDPNNPLYNISDADWTAFKRDEVWTPMYADIKADLPDVRLMINQGNDGTNFDFALDELPGSWLKAGQFTHYYNFVGEGPYAARLQALRDDPKDEHRVRGENEGTPNLDWWKLSPPQNLFALACSCLHAGVDILNISPANALADHSVYEFFNRYAGIRQASDGNLGFAALRDMVDFADTGRFPEAQFDPLVAPADQALYNNRRTMIMNSGDPPALKETKLTSLLVSGKMGQPFLNASRITKIRAAVPDAKFTEISSGDVESYNMDFGVDMIPGNYALFVEQKDPHTTSVGAYRQGPTDKMFGRFARRFAAADGKDRMTFAVDPGLLGEHKYEVRITITTLDTGTGQWSLRYWDGAEEQTAGPVIKNGNTNKPVAHSFDIDDFAAGAHLPAAGDFALQHESGADTTFFLVEVERHAQQD